jgi:chromosome segregation ATPase
MSIETPQPITSLTTTLSTAKTLITRLRYDRNQWRTRSLLQDTHIATLTNRLRATKSRVKHLTSENADLDTRLSAALVTGTTLLKSFKEVVHKNDALDEELDEQHRTIARLRKSERAKGKVWQRNLTLKALLHSKQNASPASPGVKEGVHDTLLEALAAASERIAELESAGEQLLDALDKAEDSDGSAGSVNEEEGSRLGLMEAEIRFRNVLEDEEFREAKELWGGLLET